MKNDDGKNPCSTTELKEAFIKKLFSETEFASEQQVRESVERCCEQRNQNEDFEVCVKKLLNFKRHSEYKRGS